MTSKIELYGDALLLLGEAKLASLSEDNTARRALDDAYDVTTKLCLEEGFWNFAMRAVQIESSDSVTPLFGWNYAIPKPSDWIRTLSMSASPDLRSPLMEIVDEPNYWFANIDPLYVRYVSNSTSYGMDLSLWPASFANYVALRLAARTCKRITGSDTAVEALDKKGNRAKANAMSKDAMNEPPAFPPSGSWVQSRFNGMSNRNRIASQT